MENSKGINRLIRTEECLKILDFIPSPMAIVGLDSLIEWANLSALKLLGYGSREEIIDKKVTDFIHPDYREAFLKREEEVFDGNGRKGEKIKFLRKDGTVFWGVLHSKPLTDKEGKSTGAIGCLQDMTNYIQTEQTHRNITELEGLKFMSENFK